MKKQIQYIKNLFSTNKKLKKDFKLNSETQYGIEFVSDIFTIGFNNYTNYDYSFYIIYNKTYEEIYTKSIDDEDELLINGHDIEYFENFINDCVTSIEYYKKGYKIFEKHFIEKKRMLTEYEDLHLLYEEMKDSLCFTE